MRRLFLALAAVSFFCVPSYAADRGGRPWSEYQTCVKNEAKKMTMAPASASEIAIASLYRCRKEANDYWSGFYLDLGRNKAAGERADMELERKEDEFKRMVISDVIEARMMEQGEK